MSKLTKNSKTRLECIIDKNIVDNLNKKLERWNKAMSGDGEAIMECMYEREMCSYEDLEDYRKNKQECSEDEDMTEGTTHG